MKIKNKPAETAEVDMTPMIDIVFQLIAFFMVITNFEQTQADERVKLPADQLARPPEAARENELVLNIGYNRSKTGEIESTELVFFAGEQIPVENIGRNIGYEAAIYADKGVLLKEVTVRIRADGEVPTGKVQEVIQAAQDKGFEKFALAAEQQAK